MTSPPERLEGTVDPKLLEILVCPMTKGPLEFDATRRAKVQLVELGILDRDEMPGVNETLDAAALTYVAAFICSLLMLLRLRILWLHLLLRLHWRLCCLRILQ